MISVLYGLSFSIPLTFAIAGYQIVK